MRSVGDVIDAQVFGERGDLGAFSVLDDAADRAGVVYIGETFQKLPGVVASWDLQQLLSIPPTGMVGP